MKWKKIDQRAQIEDIKKRKTEEELNKEIEEMRKEKANLKKRNEKEWRKKDDLGQMIKEQSNGEQYEHPQKGIAEEKIPENLDLRLEVEQNDEYDISSSF